MNFILVVGFVYERKYNIRMETISPLNFRLHHLRVLGGVREASRDWGKPRNANGERILISELYQYPDLASQTALDVGSFIAYSISRALVQMTIDSENPRLAGWKDMMLRSLHHAQEKVGSDTRLEKEYAKKMTASLTTLLTLPPQAEVVLSKQPDLICASCVLVNESGFGTVCVEEANDPETSEDYSHALSLAEYIKRYAGPITQTGEGLAATFSTTLGFLRDENFLADYNSLRFAMQAANRIKSVP